MKRLLSCAVAMTATLSVAEPLPMEHVLVSVPLHKKQAETALPITVLSGEELHRHAAATLGETLGDYPGIASASFGPGVGRPVIRGQQGPRAVTLQNGTRSADASSLSPDHGVAVEALLADSIEVLRGPATLLYGGGAIGGVINVIDNRIPRKPLDGVSGGVEYRFDEATGMNSGVLRLDAGQGDLAFHLSGSLRDSDDVEIPGRAIDEAALERQEELLRFEHTAAGDEHEAGGDNTKGFVANTDAEADNLTVGTSYHFGDKGFVGFSVSHLSTQYGIPPGAHGHHDDEGEESESDSAQAMEEEEENIRIDLEQTRYDAMLHLHEPVPMAEVLRLFLTATDYKHTELEGAQTGTRFDRESFESRLEIVHVPIFGVHGVIGAQWLSDEFSAVGEEAFVPPTDSREGGLFLLEDFHVGDATYELGLRGDWVERDPDAVSASSETFTSISLSGSALWQLNNDWQVGLSLSRAERAPATEELYANVDAQTSFELVEHAATGIIEIGDTDLNGEISQNLDLTLTWQEGQSYAELAVFYNRFEDYISLFNSGELSQDTPIYLYGQDDAEFYGVELEGNLQLTDSPAGSLSLRLTGDVIWGEFDAGEDVPRLPPARVGATLNWEKEGLAVWLQAQHAMKQDDPGAFETQTDGYTRWDMGVEYALPLSKEREVFASLKWKNFTDEEIRLSTSFLRNVSPEAGASLEASLRYSF